MVNSTRSSFAWILVLMIQPVAMATPTECPQLWLEGEGLPGVDGTVRASAVCMVPESTEPWLVIGGQFQVAGTVASNRIAAWDGLQWHGFGSGVNDEVLAMCSFNGELYAGGRFTQADGRAANHIARWDGKEWNPLGIGTDAVVRTMVEFEGKLIVGGSFLSAGGVERSYIAAWDGLEWMTFGESVLSPVFALHEHQGKLYAGLGHGFGAPGLPLVLQWNGSDWQPLGATAMLGYIYTLASIGDDLVAGCEVIGGGLDYLLRWDGKQWVTAFPIEPDAPVLALQEFNQHVIVGHKGGIDRWSGSHWIPLEGDPTDGLPVLSLSVFESALIVGGSLDSGNQISRNLWRWTGSKWSDLQGGVNASVAAVLSFGGEVFAGGDFTIAGGSRTSHIARWDGASWAPVGNGLDGRVRCLTEFNGELIAGGDFTGSGSQPTLHIARWDGAAWHSMGAGVSGSVAALTVWNGDLIAGVHDPKTDVRLVRWTGETWTPMTTPFYTYVYALAAYQGDLYFGGSYETNAAGTVVHFGRWDGKEWHIVGGGVNGGVRSLAVYNDELVVGGTFTSAGGIVVNRIARWNGLSWQPLGQGVSGGPLAAVLALTQVGSDLVVGGRFHYVGNAGGGALSTTNLAKWSGTNWQGIGGIGSPLGDEVSAISSHEGTTVVGGKFNSAGIDPASNIALREPGDSWQAFTGGFNQIVNALTVFKDELVAGGSFTTASGVPAGRVARWIGDRWEPLGEGMNATVNALAEYNGELLAGGSFAQADGKPASRLAIWDGATWSEFSQGASGALHALEVCEQNLFAGGSFTSIGGVPSNCIAQWHPATGWRSLAGGTPGFLQPVYSLQVYGGDLIAGGRFSSIGGVQANLIARWNGTAWQPLSDALSECDGHFCVPQVRALAIFQDELIVAGQFRNAGDVVVNNIARWDGKDWHAFGEGTNDIVYALAVYRGDLIAAGRFSMAGVTPANAIARWSGREWQALGDGLGGGCGDNVCATVVRTLKTHHGTLIVGGDFSSGGGLASAFVARWQLNCPSADVNSDGIVDQLDLIEVIQSWGPCDAACDSSPCSADLNFDGEVNVIDLLAVVSQWT